MSEKTCANENVDVLELHPGWFSCRDCGSEFYSWEEMK